MFNLLRGHLHSLYFSLTDYFVPVVGEEVEERLHLAGLLEAGGQWLDQAEGNLLDLLVFGECLRIMAMYNGTQYNCVGKCWGELCQMDYAIYLSHDAVSKDKRRSVFFKSIQLEKKDLKMRELHKT